LQRPIRMQAVRASLAVPLTIPPPFIPLLRRDEFHPFPILQSGLSIPPTAAVIEALQWGFKAGRRVPPPLCQSKHRFTEECHHPPSHRLCPPGKISPPLSLIGVPPTQSKSFTQLSLFSSPDAHTPRPPVGLSAISFSVQPSREPHPHGVVLVEAGTNQKPLASPSPRSGL